MLYNFAPAKHLQLLSLQLILECVDSKTEIVNRNALSRVWRGRRVAMNSSFDFNSITFERVKFDFQFLWLF